MMRAIVCAVLVLGGCGGEAAMMDAAPVPDHLIGEVHLHQFLAGGHAWAGFLAEPVAVTALHSDQLFDLEPPPLRRDGACALYVPPRCEPLCGGRTYCAATNHCAPIPDFAYIDAGEVRVTGSALWTLIRMWYDNTNGGYQSDPAPGPERLYAGGERLGVEGGRGELAFAGQVLAPRDVVVAAPDLSADLHFGDGPLALRWEAGGAAAVIVYASASSRVGGGSAYVRCVTADTGSLTVPGDMMAAMPPPPRDIRLEVERNEERFLPTGRAGVGVKVNAAMTAWKNGSE